MKTKQVPFDIYIPAIENRAAVKVDTIQIEVITDAHGNEMVTPASSILIDKAQARYMGLLAGSDIRALRTSSPTSSAAARNPSPVGKMATNTQANS